MARSRPGSKASSEVVLFDVVYEDGSRSSNRRIANSELAGPDGDRPAKAIIEAQDRKRAMAAVACAGAAGRHARCTGP